MLAKTTAKSNGIECSAFECPDLLKKGTKKFDQFLGV